jgi:hypothetical protein
MLCVLTAALLYGLSRAERGTAPIRVHAMRAVQGVRILGMDGDKLSSLFFEAHNSETRKPLRRANRLIHAVT